MLKNVQEDTKPPPAPKKFVTFSAHDSRAIESAYQKLADENDDPNTEMHKEADDGDLGGRSTTGNKPNTSVQEAGQDENAGGEVRVPVHEDFLFDVV